jgi:hypothetical protein
MVAEPIPSPELFVLSDRIHRLRVGALGSERVEDANLMALATPLIREVMYGEFGTADLGEKRGRHCGDPHDSLPVKMEHLQRYRIASPFQLFNSAFDRQSHVSRHCWNIRRTLSIPRFWSPWRQTISRLDLAEACRMSPFEIAFSRYLAKETGSRGVNR